MDDVWVVMPAFNESRGIGQVVRETLACFPRVLVIDDGSADETGARARENGAVVVRHAVNLGQGAALQTGFSWARERGAKWVVTLDSDGQHDPSDALRMVELARRKGVDVVLGSRFLGSTVGMPIGRRWLLRAALLFQNLTTHLRLTDVHNGLRVISAATLGKIELQQDRMAHASEIIYRISALRLSVLESPVTIRYTTETLAKGQSGLGALNILVDLLMAKLGR